MILGPLCEAKIALGPAAAARVAFLQKRICPASKPLKINDTFCNNALKPLVLKVLEVSIQGAAGIP
ncbi:MAG: hypothetical protein ACRD5G_04945, partial [Candidatus Acidiferrales bacterium]